MASEIEFRIKTAPKDKRLNLRIPGELFDYINKTHFSCAPFSILIQNSIKA